MPPERLHTVSMVEPFEHAVARHGSTVLRVCRAVAGRTDGDDAWSETFLAALRAWPDLEPGTNVEAWLVTIGHRKAIDVLRARARRAVPVGDVPQGASPLVGRVEDGRDLDLWQAVAALPTKQRHCVALHHLGGLPYDEIAALVGGSAAAARRAAADGIAALRRVYGTTEGEHA